MSYTDPKIEHAKNVKLHQFLGIENAEIDEKGSASFSIVINENNANPHGKLHGGVFYALSDSCSYLATVPLLKENEDAVTHDIHVSVMGNADLGDTVEFSAEVIRRGKRVVFINAEAKSSGRLLSRATITKSIINV